MELHPGQDSESMKAAVSRKQRFDTLVDQVRAGIQARYDAGKKLKQIRDEELYKEDGFATWEGYCSKRWEMTKSQIDKMISESSKIAR